MGLREVSQEVRRRLPRKWAIYAMDKAYVDFEALYKMQLNKTYFVTMAKDTMKYDVVDTN